MKKAILLMFIVLWTGCKPLSNVERNRLNETFKVQESGTTKIERPGDVFILPAPRTPNERPKDTTITSKGAQGTTVTTSYDKDGFLAGQIINTPVTKEESQYDLKSEYNLKTLELTRKLDIEVVNAVGKWSSIILIPAFAFLALAWYFRSRT